MSIGNYPKIMTISRHRMGSDGEGVSTLVTFWGCPLHCKYCINDFCHDENYKCIRISPEKLYERLVVDDIYYRMSDGGIVFGGGEPLLQSEYIVDTVKLFPNAWKVRIETSLNVDWRQIEPLIPFVDQWIIDIKDMNPAIYKRYTGLSNEKVVENLEYLSQRVTHSRIFLRVPNILGYNTAEDVKRSIKNVEKYGYIDFFNYRVIRTKAKKCTLENEI